MRSQLVQLSRPAATALTRAMRRGILFLLQLAFIALLGLGAPPVVDAKPAAYALPSPDQVLQNMRQIPQWHCLRYRKFDLTTQLKRCRNFRMDRKH